MAAPCNFTGCGYWPSVVVMVHPDYQYTPKIIPAIDKELTDRLQKGLEKKGIRFLLATKVEKIEQTGGGLAVTADKGGEKTVLPCGQVLVSTLVSTVSPALLQDIAQAVLTAFRQAADAGVPLSELIVRYSAFKITARELRGGAIVFLAPHSTLMVSPLV